VRLLAGPAFVLLSVICGAAVAATANIIAERRETMKSFAGASRTIGDMFAGKRPYDSRRFKAAAELIRQKSGNALRGDFPPGSTGEGSEATPEIFADWDEFTLLSDQLGLLAAALSSAADRSPKEIGGDMRMRAGMAMGGSLLGGRAKPLTEREISAFPAEHVFHLMLEQCTTCHAKFRIRQK